MYSTAPTVRAMFLSFFFFLHTVVWFRVFISVTNNYISKVGYLVEGDPKAPFSITTTPRCREDATLFHGLLHFSGNKPKNAYLEVIKNSKNMI